MKSRIKVLFMAAEADPFVKIGGLGDVAGSLPAALQRQGKVDIRLIIPFHAAIRHSWLHLQPIATFEIPHASGPLLAEALATEINKLPVYLISGAPIHSQAGVYSSDTYTDGHKYTFFSLAALELMRILEWSPDIVHANDWHTAPAIVALSQKPDPIFKNTATVMGLHNLPYLGNGAGPAMNAFGLPPSTNQALPWWAQNMPLPLGLLHADHIVTVSPTYAQEIMTPEFGSGLDDFLRTRAARITGILNGLNTERWDPATDEALLENYTSQTLEKRLTDKSALLSEFGLNPDPTLPLLGVVSRLDPQKGMDLISPAMAQLMDLPWQMVILGTGVEAFETAIREFEAAYPARVRAAIRFDDQLSHKIYAGADMLLIPSRYEPCGLTQMIAMRYGCVPIARATGGLRDTIRDLNSAPPVTGFLFKEPTATDLASAIRRALQTFTNPAAWRAIQHNGMLQDFSWERSACDYLELYRSLLES